MRNDWGKFTGSPDDGVGVKRAMAVGVGSRPYYGTRPCVDCGEPLGPGISHAGTCRLGTMNPMAGLQGPSTVHATWGPDEWERLRVVVREEVRAAVADLLAEKSADPEASGA